MSIYLKLLQIKAFKTDSSVQKFTLKCVGNPFQLLIESQHSSPSLERSLYSPWYLGKALIEVVVTNCVFFSINLEHSARIS